MCLRGYGGGCAARLLQIVAMARPHSVNEEPAGLDLFTAQLSDLADGTIEGDNPSGSRDSAGEIDSTYSADFCERIQSLSADGATIPHGASLLLTQYMKQLSSLEICAGAGGQAFGLERAGFAHTAVVEIDAAACATLRRNRPQWDVIEQDVRTLSGKDYRGIDLLAGGVPCPPFSVAGRQLGADDSRDLFPTALNLVEEAKPNAVILENVPGLSAVKFADYRAAVKMRLQGLGYVVHWIPLNARDFGVPQLRPRFVLIALRKQFAKAFIPPQALGVAPTVGDVLYDLMAARGWPGAAQWAERANAIAPTLVGGSKLHGGPDLGPTRAKRAWRELAVDGMGIADQPPDVAFPIDGFPKLTVRMTARLQGFPDSWEIVGKKTSAYRQVGNAFPPPVARAVGDAVRRAILGKGPGRVSEPELLLRLG